MMFSGRAEQASKEGFSLPGICPSTTFFILSSVFNAPALCSLYPNTYYQIEVDRWSKSRGFTVRHLDLDLHCITCQLFKLLNISKPQFSQVTRCYKKCLHPKIIVTIQENHIYKVLSTQWHLINGIGCKALSLQLFLKLNSDLLN